MSHESEEEFDLARLPEGESILWEGKPAHRSLSRHAFHVPMWGGYFGLILVVRIAIAISGGESLGSALVSSAGLFALTIVCLALFELLAWLNARATAYTITNRRVVLRIGVAIVIALNLPHRRIQSAVLRTYPDGSGDIALGVEGSAQLGYALLWPHARPWRFGERTQPMLRSVPDAAAVAEILTGQLASTVRTPLEAAAVRPRDGLHTSASGADRRAAAVAAAG